MLSIATLLFFFAYAFFLGIKIAHGFCWTNVPKDCFLPLSTAVGLGLVPFILGFPIILSLYFFAGYSPAFHFLFLFCFFIALHCIAPALPTKTIFFTKKTPLKFEELYFGSFLICMLFLLFFNSFYYPLYQNDALEYMTVSKQLFMTNSLHSYPMINQESTVSGFYGPWTHPPLYVALLYLIDIIQGHASLPGLSRIISPLAGVLVVLIVYSLGGLHNRIAAVTGALICVLTPLFFLGATSSLIDSLSTLGFVLVFAGLAGLDSRYKRKWIVVGVFTGLSLWAHSQAILLLPILAVTIFFLFGYKNWKYYVQALSIILFFALATAIWPYLRNWYILGSIVSDNTFVLSLPNLGWDNYFNYARGIDNTVAKVQYGLFKGWFSFEAFGASFWLMTISLVLFNKQFWRFRFFLSRGMESLPKSEQVFSLSCIFLLIYLFGTLLSILLDLNIMIKNERYLLVMLPFVAIVSGYGIDYILVKTSIYLNKNILTKYIYYFISIILFISLSFYLYFLTVAYPSKYILPLKNTIDPVTYTVKISSDSIHNRLLKNLPSPGLMLMAKSLIPEDALILSLRPSDMYYLERRMISYLDPRLGAFYQEKNKCNAVKMLKDLGVNYIHVTDYSFPAHYNSALNQILKDPHLTKLVVSHLANEIYQLVPVDGQFKLVKDFTPGKLTWSYYKDWNLMGRKSLFQLMPRYNTFSILKEKKLLNFKKSWPINQRHFSHIIFSRIGGNIYDSIGDNIKLDPEKEYRVDFDLEGDGFIRLYMLELDELNHPIQYYKDMITSIRIGELALSRNSGRLRFSKRFIAQGSKVIFIIETVGSSALLIKEAKLYELEDKNEHQK